MNEAPALLDGDFKELYNSFGILGMGYVFSKL
jgi:hypothetical protein